MISRDLTEYKTDLIEDNIDRVGFTNMESEVFDARVLDEEHIEAASVRSFLLIFLVHYSSHQETEQDVSFVHLRLED